jgi:hypothetical protein
MNASLVEKRKARALEYRKLSHHVGKYASNSLDFRCEARPIID